MRTLSKKQKIGATIAAAGVLAVAGGGIAFAYFGGGNGTGSGSAATTASASRAIVPSATASGVAYDGTTTVVPITLTNNNPYSLQVASVVMTINTSDSSWATATCPTDSFTLGGSASGTPWTVPAKSGATPGTSTVNGYTIKFVDNPNEDQTGCIGFSVPLSITAS